MQTHHPFMSWKTWGKNKKGNKKNINYKNKKETNF